MGDDGYHFDVDEEILIELGRLLYSASYLEEVLQRVFGLLTGDPLVGDAVAAFQPMRWLLERSRWICDQQLEEGSPIRDTTWSWLERAEKAQQARNKIVHAAWYVDATKAHEGLLRHGLRRFKRPKAGEVLDYDWEVVEPAGIRAVAQECEATGLAGLSLAEWLNEEFSRR